MAKRIELLRELTPRLARVAVIFNAANESIGPTFRTMDATARSLKVDLQSFEVRGPQDFEVTGAAIQQRGHDAVIVADDPVLRSHGRSLAEVVARRRLPSVGDREYAVEGGLFAYAVNRVEIWRRAAVFVDKVLRGAVVGELPFQQADRIEFVINLKTAKALNLAIPRSLLLRADQVIE